MGVRLFSGTAVGVIVSLLSWRGNSSPGLVSIIPDALTGIVLVGLMCITVLFCARQYQARTFAAIWKIGFVISVTAGIILGAAMTAKAVELFHSPHVSSLAVLFLSALVIVMVCGFAASLLARYLPAGGDRKKEI
jgi:hypothetical protein